MSKVTTTVVFASRMLRRIVVVACVVIFECGGVQAVESPVNERLVGVQTLAPLIKQVTKSIVSIKAVRRTVVAYPSVGPGSGFPDGPLPLTESSFGSGVVVDAERGLIVTSNHVVNGAIKVEVELSDGRQMEANVTEADERSDLALLRISATGLTVGRLGKSVEVAPGDFILAIGDPVGLGQSVSFGIVSAIHRSWQGIACTDLIQTDALLDFGSSGGPLFNLRGEIIGIVAARIGETSNERSFGFAVPSAAIERLLAKRP